MKTDQLISALAADLPNKPTPFGRAIGLALAVSLPLMLALLFGIVKVRPGLGAMLLEPKIIFKFAFTLGLMAAAVWLAIRINRPGQTAGPARYGFGVVLLALFGAVGIELVMRPAETWAAVTVGSYALPCLGLIGLFSIAPFAALMVAFKTGAPDNPTLAGATAGLIAGSLAAAIYATHCVEDSALFLAVWYVLAISAVTLAGAIIGRKTLRW